jgi:putative aldouronate transport system permease protein
MTGEVVDSSEKEFLAITIKYATIIVSTLPILTAYPFIQKYFIKGVMIGAIKG